MKLLQTIRLPLVASLCLKAVAADPALTISLSPGLVTIEWPTNPPGYQLQERFELSTSSPWQYNLQTPALAGDRYRVVTNPIASSLYFRLVGSQVEEVEDSPDASYEDSNGDGIDGNITNAIFVAMPPTGDDGNPGTMDLPLATLQKGLESAGRFSPPKEVYVSKGVYPQATTLQLVSGVSIYGQYDATNQWRRAATNDTTISGPSTAIRAVFVTRETHVEGFHIQATNAHNSGESSYAIRAFNVSGTLVVRYNRITAGAGASGLNGTHGRNGEPGGGGEGGAAGDDGGSGGSGGTSSCGRNGGRGGLGGLSSPGVWGSPGQGWDGIVGSPSSPGRGGAMGPPCDDAQGGFNGTGGADGTPGTSGGPVTDFGALVDDQFLPGRGNPGTSGTAGDGGGGAGGGGANQLVLFACPAYIGGGGGGGGGGGCAGTAGEAGTGGGGSFGIFLVSSAATITDNQFETGNGGQGGVGGNGGLGGAGGTAGPNGEGWRHGAAGGVGGKGGNGGAAGSGSGGPGGPVIGIFHKGTNTVVLQNNSMFLGLPGNGGQGGTNAVLGAAPAGPKGILLDVLGL